MTHGIDIPSSSEGLFRALGCEVQDSQITDADPNVIQKAAYENFGLEVALVDDYLEGSEFLDLRQRGKTVLATKDPARLHDVVHHLPVEALGGEEMTEIGVFIARYALKQGYSPDIAGEYVDRYPEALGAVVLGLPEFDNEVFDAGNGRRTVQLMGRRLGVSSDRTNQLIGIVQTRAQAIGLEPRELM